MLVATACPLADLIVTEGLRAEFDAKGKWEMEKIPCGFVTDRSCCCNAIYNHRYSIR